MRADRSLLGAIVSNYSVCIMARSRPHSAGGMRRIPRVDYVDTVPAALALAFERTCLQPLSMGLDVIIDDARTYVTLFHATRRNGEWKRVSLQ